MKMLKTHNKKMDTDITYKQITRNSFNVFIYGLVYKVIAPNSYEARIKATKRYIKEFKPTLSNL